MVANSIPLALDVQPIGCASQVTRTVVLSAPVGRVWEAISTQEALSAWLGLEVAAVVRTGGRGLATRPDGAIRRIRFEAVEPGTRLAFRWWPFEELGVRPAGQGTRVDITLSPTAAGTRVTVTEAPPESADSRITPGVTT